MLNEYQLRVDESQSRDLIKGTVLIDTRMWMPLVHMIHTKFVNLAAPGSNGKIQIITYTSFKG